eukprot:scaffold18080_cov22-Tisochrysis_lutea.AAC.1
MHRGTAPHARHQPLSTLDAVPAHLLLELQPQRGRGRVVLHHMVAQLRCQQPHSRALATTHRAWDWNEQHTCVLYCCILTGKET